MSHNAQIADREKTCVYVSTFTGRILGFGHEQMKPMFKEGWTRTLLSHASEIDSWAEKYRKQEQEDRESDDFQKSERESPARAAIRAALLDRRSYVDGPNRAFIDANLRLMDMREERARKRKETAFLLCEQKEGAPRSEDIALESPAFKSPMPIDGTSDASAIRDAVRRTLRQE